MKFKPSVFILSLIVLVTGFIFIKKVYSNMTTNPENMYKKVVRKTEFVIKPAFPGLKGVDIMAHAFPIEPFLVFTEFYMDRPVFGPHPHAGVSVMTYMLPDSKGGFINRDSQGDFSFIEPGGMHIMQAGRGMFHDEFPKDTGTETHGFQIWINHADKDRFVDPLSMHASAAEVPEIITDDYKVRIVHGSFLNTSPAYKMVTDVDLFHVFLQPLKSITLDAKQMAFVYGLRGSGNSGEESVHPQFLLNYTSEGSQITLNAGIEGLECMFASGKPHNEPITYGGPFVMTTPEQMAETKRRYTTGEMGKLEPYHGK
ncbi:MAG: pirin family protein [Saprospiraceae bacterium]|nr:pirin family protein [Saprospiraceae bacterium]